MALVETLMITTFIWFRTLVEQWWSVIKYHCIAIFNQTGVNHFSLRHLGTKMLDNPIQEVQFVCVCHTWPHLADENVPAITDIVRLGTKGKAQGAAQGAQCSTRCTPRCSFFIAFFITNAPQCACRVNVFQRITPGTSMNPSSNIERWRIFTNNDTVVGVT